MDPKSQFGWLNPSITFIVLFLGGFFTAQAQEKEKFNAGDMIVHHVTDSHEIHFITFNEGTPQESHISIPLPIIAYSDQKGLELFSSGHFYHNEQEVTYQKAGSSVTDEYFVHGDYVMFHEKIYLKDNSQTGITLDAEGHATNVKVLDFSITKTVAGMFIAILFMLFVFSGVSSAYKRNPKKAPKGLQGLLEPLFLFIRDEVAKPSIGPKYARFMPYLLSVFFFILFANLLGLIPFIGAFNVTGNIAVTATLALFTFFVTTFSGNKDYWIHIFNTPGVPWWLKFPIPLMPIIELIGVISKPLVLCLRLFANITAGHIIILSFTALIFIFGSLYGDGAGLGVSIVSLIFGIFMNVLEILVAFLQAYVFTLLSAIYFGAAVEEHHHEEHVAH